ncbi:hypothetical protein BC938DRAFT_476709, partial [Jimgerdemannia flammicorona]
ISTCPPRLSRPPSRKSQGLLVLAPAVLTDNARVVMAPSELPVVIATTTDARKAVPPVISSPSSAEGLVVADLAL